jgi:hypothetical protein
MSNPNVPTFDQASAMVDARNEDLLFAMNQARVREDIFNDLISQGVPVEMAAILINRQAAQINSNVASFRTLGGYHDQS